MFALGILASLITLAIPIVVIVWVVRASRRGEPHTEQAGWSLRRFLQYAFLLTALFVAASGVSTILSYALPAGTRLAGRAPADLALGLSLALVGTPVGVLLWRVVRRRLEQDSEERGSPAWTLYVTTAGTVALVVALPNLVEAGAWVLGAADFDASSVGTGLTWGAVWGAHVFLARHWALGPQGRLASLPALAGSAVGVVALALATAGILFSGFEQVYRAVAGDPLADATTTEDLRRSAVLAVLAGGAWWWHWLRVAVRGPYDRLWHAYVLLVPILGGTLTATVSAAIVLHAVVRWLLGGPGLPDAALHFDVLPGALAALLVGAWAWWYHRWVLQERDADERTEAERTYAYLVAGVGLVAAAGGAAVALVGLLQAVAPAPLATAGSATRDTLAVAITLLLVGAPVWWVFWRPLQARAHAEAASPSRRAYLFLLFGASGLTALVSLAVVLYVLLRDLLEGRLDAGVLYDLRVALALVITAGAVAAYHWTVYREDRHAGPAETRPKTVLLVSSDGRAGVRAITARTPATVRTLRRTDGALPLEDWDGVAAAVEASPHERLLVIVEGDGEVRVIPYDVD
jgi:hypothetical protein